MTHTTWIPKVGDRIRMTFEDSYPEDEIIEMREAIGVIEYADELCVEVNDDDSHNEYGFLVEEFRGGMLWYITDYVEPDDDRMERRIAKIELLSTVSEGDISE